MTNFAVTNIDKVQEGTYGYIIKLDTTNIKAYDIEFIQAYDETSGTSSAPSDGSYPLKSLYSFVEDSNAPDLAFNYTHGICSMFFKTSKWPYTVNTKISIFGKRNALKMEEATDLADFPDELMELFSAYVIKYASMVKGKPIPASVERTILREEYDIKNS